MASGSPTKEGGGAASPPAPLLSIPGLADSIMELVKQTMAEANNVTPRGKSPHRSKRERSRRKRTRSPSSEEDSSSSSSSRSDRKHKRHSRSRSKRSKRENRRGGAPPTSDDTVSLPEDPAALASSRYWQEEQSSLHSGSEAGGGEFSGEEDSERVSRSNRLCPPDMYLKVMAKAAAAIHLEMPAPEPVPVDPKHRATLYPITSSGPPAIPFPEALEGIFHSEWAALNRPRHHRNINSFYTLPASVMSRLRVPAVDPPVVAVANATTLPSEGESGPKDPCDKRTELAFRKGFEYASHAFRASVACSNLTRAILVWSDELTSLEPKLSSKAKALLKKIGLAAGAAADGSYDAMQGAVRSMGASVSGRRQLWLRQWQGDSASTSRILNLPFKGGRLFGDDLDPMLVEDSDKRKVLPSKKVPPKKQPFRGFSSGFKPRATYQNNKPRWHKGKPGFTSKYRKPGNAPSHPPKEKQGQQTA